MTNLSAKPKGVVHFYNRRGTAEQWIKEGKYALNWTRLSCHRFVANQVRLQLFILAYNLGNFLRRLCLPKAINDWSLRSLQVKLIKIGGRPTVDQQIKPDISSPGWKIMAAKYNSANGYTEMSGTSMATPFLAGVAALMLNAEPSSLSSDVKTTIMDYLEEHSFLYAIRLPANDILEREIKHLLYAKIKYGR
ncbi:hypothetical protein ES703_06266 [subsurface metagenome]